MYNIFNNKKINILYIISLLLLYIYKVFIINRKYNNITYIYIISLFLYIYKINIYNTINVYITNLQN